MADKPTLSSASCARPAQPAVNRRQVFRSLGGAAALVAAGVAAPRLAKAAGKTTLRFWTSQSAPNQMKVWQDIFGRFEAQHPDFTVAIEKYSDDTLWPKLSAAYAARDLPDLITYVQAYTVVTLNQKGLIEPFDDVIKAVGEDDFYPNMRDVYKDKGSYMAATLNNQTSSNLFYRTDLLQEAGVEPPRYWDELLNVAKKTTKNGIYGNTLPFGRNSMASTMMVMFVRQSGGAIVNPDMSVAFNSPEVVATLEFLKEIFQYAPPGATNYSWGETLNAFVTGKTACAPYTGRPIYIISAQNPSLADKFSRVPYPHRREGRAAYDCPFNSIFIPRGAKNVEPAKLLARALFEKHNYIEFLHTAPGHNLSSLKSISKSPEFWANPLLQKYRKEVDGMIETTAESHNLVKESDDRPYDTKAGDIFNSMVLAETLQDVVVNGVSPKQAAARGADKIAEIVKG